MGKLSEALERPKIASSKDVYDIIFPLISDLPHEEFWILLLNRSNKIIDKNKISQGGVAGTVIDVKIILRNAIEKLASSVYSVITILQETSNPVKQTLG